MNNNSIAVVIPCYKVANYISKVVNELPDIVTNIILVNDASPDNTKEVLEKLSKVNTKITVLHNKTNQGVGGAMITGFNEAIKKNYDIVIKLDGDGQMNSSYIPQMIKKIEIGYDFVKGNRFFDRKSLKKMPTIRKIGNMGMGFLVKVASGYWNIFDPTNGYFAITNNTLKKINLKKLSKRFFFESSLLIELYYTGAKIKDVSMKSIYANEISNLSIAKSLLSFPPKLLKAYIKRIVLQYFIYDFNIASLYFLLGLPLTAFGFIFGIIKWHYYYSIFEPAPTGTIMLSVLPLILGFQMLLAAIQFDMTCKNPFEIDD